MRLRWPLADHAGHISQHYRENPYLYGYSAAGHTGLDFGAVTGTPVVACHAGIVATGQSPMFGIYAKVIGSPMTTQYSHLSRLKATDGVAVQPGTVIGYVGTTGNSTASHLDLMLWVNGTRCDPEIYLEDEMPSKLSWHFQTTTPWMGPVVNSTPVAYVKQMFYSGDEPDAFPQKRTVARIWVGGDGIEHRYIDQGASGAALYYTNLLPYYNKLRGKVYAIEGPNEPMSGSPAERANLVAFTTRWVELMHAGSVTRGYKCVGGNFPVTWPQAEDPATIRELAPLFQATDYLGLHQYRKGDMRLDAEWFTLKHRMLANTLKGLNVRMPPVFLGEYGIDGGATKPGEPQLVGKGWKAQNPPVSWEQYFEQLKWGDAELAKDDIVVAAFIFTSAPTQDWATFDIGENESKRLAAYINAGGIAAPPVEPPPPKPGLTREQAEELARDIEAVGAKLATFMQES